MSRARAFAHAVLPPVAVSAVRRARRRVGLGRGALSAPHSRLSDGVIELRLIDKKDLAMIERASKDSDIRQPFGLSKPSEYLARWKNASRDGSGAAFTVCDAEGERRGLVTVDLGKSGRAHLAYWLLPEGRGRGHATSALRLVSRWALERPGVARLELMTTPENVPSQQVAERSGFRREGILRSYNVIDGRREDAVVYSLLPGDLEESAP